MNQSNRYAKLTTKERAAVDKMLEHPFPFTAARIAALRSRKPHPKPETGSLFDLLTRKR